MENSNLSCCTRRKFSLKGVVQAAICLIAISSLTMPTPSSAQPGFLSIDCGATGGNYTDALNLTWVSDEGKYIKSGRSLSLPSPPDGRDVRLQEAQPVQSLTSFRYFPDRRWKDCYELPTVPNSSYLLRVRFYMNESELNARRPFLFRVSVNATSWFSLADGDTTLPDFLVTQEGIFHSPDSVLNLCLQPVVGFPFISSVELRRLEPDMYDYSGLLYLHLVFRYNIGANYTIPNVRFPNDKYDRIWQTLGEYDALELPILSVAVAPDQTTRPEVNYVPPEVMKSAWAFTYPISGLVANIFFDDPQVSLPPRSYAFFILYAERLNATDSQIYPLNVSVDGRQGPAWNFTNRATIAKLPNFILSSNAVYLDLGLASGERLADGPSLNAAECYIQYNFNFSKTYRPDDLAITALKTSFNLTDWQGDPCVPVPHNWLDCSLDSLTFQPIRQPCYSDGTSVSQCVVQDGFLQSTYYVVKVSLSNLPQGGFDLFKASAGISLESLTNLSITGSGVDGESFQYFVSTFSNLTKLSGINFRANAIDSIPNWSMATNLVDLDLSDNNITNLTPSSEDLPLPLTLQILNLSYNGITSLPPAWRTTTNNLVILDLSHNNLQNNISSLDQMLQMNSGSLQQLRVSDSKLQGTFNSSLYFSTLANLSVADFSGNQIQGTLNLTLWYNALKIAVTPRNAKLAAASNDTQPVLYGGKFQSFAFVNNNITDIIPNVKAFDRSVQQLLESQQLGGILLGGNPYCSRASSYTHRFLCRSTVTEITERDGKKSSKVAIIVGICAGTFGLFCSCFVLVTFWKLWQQVFALREIQRALADRKVQPPFFHYSDLKLATKDFHQSCRLGHGSFGVVYQGVLGDGTMLAVKELFATKRQQLLDEFLNEVVLITGIKHRNLVQLKGCCIKDKRRMLVYEYAEKGNLAEALWGLKLQGKLDWEQRYDVCLGVARGLAYLHEELQPSIIHRDIKPANILLDKNFKPKIADFGLARHYEDDTNQSLHTQVAGTLGYFAPEYAMEGQLSNKADVYSYGIVVLEILSGRKCIDASQPQEQKFLKTWACTLIREGSVLEILEPDLRDSSNQAEVIRLIYVALLCVQYHPQRRPSMSQVVLLLSEDMGVDGHLSESRSTPPSLKDLVIAIGDEVQYPALQRLAEESTMFPHLPLDSLASSSGDSTSAKTSDPST